LLWKSKERIAHHARKQICNKARSSSSSVVVNKFLADDQRRVPPPAHVENPVTVPRLRHVQHIFLRKHNAHVIFIYSYTFTLCDDLFSEHRTSFDLAWLCSSRSALPFAAKSERFCMLFIYSVFFRSDNSRVVL
jgi:hypothetical protein